MLTTQGVEELRHELERLRAELVLGEDRLAKAMERAGDAGEVGEYLDAQREQELIERRVAVIEEWIENAHPLVVPPTAHEQAELGAQAEFEDIDSGERSSFELVASPESNIARGRLSIDSPVGHALLGHHAGETVEVATPRGRRHLKLVSIH